MNDSKKPMRLPMLGGSKSTGLVVRPGTNSLANSDHKSDSDLISRFKGTEAAAAASITMDKFRQNGVEEIARREIEKDIKAACATTQLRVSTVIDYTCSTVNDVANFVRETRMLLEMLQKEFPAGVDLLPVAARGQMSNMLESDVVVGNVNDIGFYGRIKNQAYDGPNHDGATPIGAGMSIVTNGPFYRSVSNSENCVQALIAISDTRFQTFPDHQQVVQKLKKTGVAVASLNSDSPQSHLEALADLKDQVIVVDRKNPRVNPIQLIFEFLLNLRNNFLHSKVTEAYLKTKGPKVNLSVKSLKGPGSFADHLILKGHANEAKNILTTGYSDSKK